MPYFFAYQKNHKATPPLSKTVSEIEIIRNFLPTPFEVWIVFLLDFFSLVIVDLNFTIRVIIYLIINR